MAKLTIYKRNQGKRVRLITGLSVMGLVVIGAVRLSGVLSSWQTTDMPAIRFGVPVLLVLGFGALMFWLLNRPSTADFLIATEGEMKKVSWSSRKEVIGATKVVIAATLITALLLFSVDLVFNAIIKHVLGQQ